MKFRQRIRTLSKRLHIKRFGTIKILINSETSNNLKNLVDGLETFPFERREETRPDSLKLSNPFVAS
jgi:hypothetical protein